MGLHDAIVKRIGFSLVITDCVKCFGFWAVLALNLVKGSPIISSIAVSFLCSYAALWISLAYDALTIIYNRLYDKITTGTAEETDSDETAEAPSDALP